MLTRVRRLTTPLAVTLLAGGTALGTVAVASSAAADQGGVPAIPLNTEQETTGSNTGASGFFSYTVQGAMLCYTLTVRDLSVPATAAHIHLAPRHVAGPIEIHLDGRVGDDVRDLDMHHPATRPTWPDCWPTRGATTSTSTRRRSPAERSAASSSDLTRIHAYPPPPGERPVSAAFEPPRAAEVGLSADWGGLGRRWSRSAGGRRRVRIGARRCAWNRSDACSPRGQLRSL